MRILVFGTDAYRDIVAKQFQAQLGLQVVNDVNDAVNKVHVVNFQGEATEENRLALEADVTVWVNLDGISNDDPTYWDIRLQEKLSDKHLVKLVKGINERYIND
jgi:hypothetical protein